MSAVAAYGLSRVGEVATFFDDAKPRLRNQVRHSSCDRLRQRVLRPQTIIVGIRRM